MKLYIYVSILGIFASLALESNAFAAKKDFKGLFGSYRREKFTENEARNSDFGVDIILSTLLPISPLVKSEEDTTRTAANLNYATFFNVEASLWYSLAYNWALYANFAHYSYETRKENQTRTDPTLPLFHQFEMEAIPVIAGLRYRLSREDIVPYLSVGAGMAYVKRKGSYDYDPTGRFTDTEYKTVACGHAALGLEFYFASRAGLRLEMSAYYFNLPARRFDTGGAPGNLPILNYQANVWSVRYGSGVFMLF